MQHTVLVKPWVVLFFALQGAFASVIIVALGRNPLPLLFAVATLLVVLAEVRWPGFLLLLLLLGFILGGRLFAKTELGRFGSIPLYPGEAVLALTGTICVLRYLPCLKQILLGLPYKRHVLSLMVLGAIAVWRGWSASPTEALRGYAIIYYVLPLWLVPLLVRTPKSFQRGARILFLAACLLSALLLIAWETLTDLPWDIVTPGVAWSLFICLGLFLSVLFFIYQAASWRLWAMIVPLQLYLLLRLHVRSAWVGIACAGCFLYLFLMKDRRLVRRLGQATVFALLLITGILFWAKTDLNESVTTRFRSIFFFQQMEGVEAENARWRLDIWSDVIEQSVRTPILGLGFGRPFVSPRLLERGFVDPDPDRSERESPHNSFLFLILYGGIPLSFLYMLLIVRVLRDGIRWVKGVKDNKMQIYALWLLSLFLAIVGGTCFSPLLETPYLGILAWTIAGALIALKSLNNAKSFDKVQRKLTLATRQQPAAQT